MATRIDDRWLWLGASVAFLAATHAIRYAIRDTISLTELEPQEGKIDDEQDKQPEDSISVETLWSLAASPNPSISNAAISLVVSRFTRLPNASAQLKHDASSADPELKRRAQTAITFLGDWPMPPGMELPAPHARGFEYDDGTGLSRQALGANNSSGAVDYVTEAEVEDYRRQVIAGTQRPTHFDPPTVNHTDAQAMAIRHRVHAMLRGNGRPDDLLPEYDGAVPRFHAHGESEEVRRRGRREAMVLHDGSGRIVEDDIIRPRVQSPG